MKQLRLPVLLASLYLVSVVPIKHAEGQCRINEGAKLTASDHSAGDHFGDSLSMSGNVAVAGARFNNDAGVSSGSAYIFRFNSGAWVEEQKLTASDAAATVSFGASVSVSGNVTVVGANKDNDMANDAGAAYVYRYNGNTWAEEQKLTASDGAEFDYFGHAVANHGDWAMIGAPQHDEQSGSVYMYRFNGNGWVEVQKLAASDGAVGDQFGWAVSVSDDVAVVGARWDDDACPNYINCNSGSAYVYRFNGREWIEEQKLTSPDGEEMEYFGFCVSVSSDVVIVGSIRDENMGAHTGATYVYGFDGNKWVEEQKLTASDGVGADHFGASVSISADVIVVGATGVDDLGYGSGAAYGYTFDGNSWIEELKITASDADSFGALGLSVAVSEGMVIVGAHGPNNYTGVAYVFGVNQVASDPPCGAIDARQPSAPDGTDPTGWESIALTFDDPPGELNAEDLAVVISPPGSAPGVTDVTVDGNTATVHFDEIIPTKAWTTITHWPTGAVTRIGSLPADVNNDKLSNANDVLYLIDVLNGVIDPAPPAYQTDTDRSGATNASDVLRVIDLLNGAGVYEEYLDAELPA